MDMLPERLEPQSLDGQSVVESENAVTEFSVPQWSDIPKYPVTTIVGLIAIAVTLAWWSKIDISPLFENALIRRGQLWRLVTCVFPHIDILHLVFDLYWLWIFGSVVEEAYGHAKTAWLMLFFAASSSSLDFAFADGGVGLSGVGYGLFGLLWSLSWRDARFRKVMHSKVVWLFVGWFVFCIATTLTHIYPVANVAHAAGGVVGILLGSAMAIPKHRTLLSGSVVFVFLFGLWGSTYGRPLVNLSPSGPYDEGKRGYDALIAHHNEDAIWWFQDALRYRTKVSAYWYDLGIAYDRVGNTSAARQCYERALKMKPDDSDYLSAVKSENAKK